MERTDEEKLRRAGDGDTGTKFSLAKQYAPRPDDITNTITGVQKDNLLLVPVRIKQATNIGYVECPPGGGLDAAYPSSKLRRGRVQENGDVVGAITSTSDGHCVYMGCAIRTRAYAGRPTAIECNNQEIANSITTVQKASMIMKQEPKENLTDPKIVGYSRDAKGHVVSHHLKEETNTFCPGNLGGVRNTAQYVAQPQDVQYRIRKLTPRECFRLMDVDDDRIDQIQAAGISKSQQYKLAGNSIVVSCLYHIFHKMFIDTSAQIGQQLTLF